VREKGTTEQPLLPNPRYPSAGPRKCPRIRPRHHRTAVSNSANTVPYLPASARDKIRQMLTHACSSAVHHRALLFRSYHAYADALSHVVAGRTRASCFLPARRRLGFEIASAGPESCHQNSLALAGFTRVTTQPPCMDCAAGKCGLMSNTHKSRRQLRPHCIECY
jgi:hypothetical protein